MVTSACVRAALFGSWNMLAKPQADIDFCFDLHASTTHSRSLFRLVPI
jgi:hypothetical protein